MAERKMKVKTRAPESGSGAEVLVQISHPMETGQRTDKETKQKIPAHFIQKVTLEHNGKPVVVVDCGPGVSEDPLFMFRIKDAKKGDKLRVSWSDNKGEKGSAETTIES
jgi:sulfur-oxidizing protein SoxZ